MYPIRKMYPIRFDPPYLLVHRGLDLSGLHDPLSLSNIQTLLPLLEVSHHVLVGKTIEHGLG